MATNVSESIRLLVREAYARRAWMAGGFAFIAIAVTLIGMAWPKTYTSYSTVYMEDGGVVAPLLEGAAVAARMSDRSVIAREVIYGRRLLSQVVKDGGWPLANKSAAAVDGVIEGIKKRTLVTNVGDNLVRIEYTDSDPERAQRVTQRIAELFVSESVGAKSHESEAAYAFIDQQVNDYGAKLGKLQGKINRFRASNPDAEPGAEEDSSHRVAELKDRLVELEQDLREAAIRRGVYQGELSGSDGGTAAAIPRTSLRAEEYRRRIAELSTQLDTLRLTYRDGFPDIVRLKEQIQELESALESEDSGGRMGAARADSGATGGGAGYLDLRRELSESSTALQTIKSRIEATRGQLRQEEQRSARVRAASTELADLMRDYSVNAGLYEELLKRREAARVSMNLDRTKSAANIRVEEPAFLPHNSIGPGQALFSLGGLGLGILLPFGALFALQQVDPRVRHSSAISERLGLPVLGVVPHLPTAREGTAEARGVVSLALLVLGTLIAVAALSLASGRL